MTAELFYLSLTALWLAILWIPVAIGAAKYDSANLKANYVTPPNRVNLPAWVQRANRAHVNLVEQFAPFAVLVIVAHLMGISNDVTVFAAKAYFGLRIIHSFVMWLGISKIPLRTLIFAGAFVCIMLMAWQVLATG